jgi:hypothetical protein
MISIYCLLSLAFFVLISWEMTASEMEKAEEETAKLRGKLIK